MTELRNYVVLALQTKHTRHKTIISIFLIETPVFNRILKIIGVQN